METAHSNRLRQLAYTHTSYMFIIMNTDTNMLTHISTNQENLFSFCTSVAMEIAVAGHA